MQVCHTFFQFFSVFFNIDYWWTIEIYTFFFCLNWTFLYWSCWSYVLKLFNSLVKIFFLNNFKLIKKEIVHLIKCKISKMLNLRLLILFTIGKLRFILLLFCKILLWDLIDLKIKVILGLILIWFSKYKNKSEVYNYYLRNSTKFIIRCLNV